MDSTVLERILAIESYINREKTSKFKLKSQTWNPSKEHDVDRNPSKLLSEANERQKQALRNKIIQEIYLAQEDVEMRKINDLKNGVNKNKTMLIQTFVKSEKAKLQ